MLTQARLKEVLDYDPETGLFRWKVTRRGSSVKSGACAGNPNNKGYLRIGIHHERYYAHRLAFLWVTGDWPKHEVDHINGVRDDNRWCNLRDVSIAENHHNIGGPLPSNTSGYLGVRLNRGGCKWSARIELGGKKVHLGSFPTPEAAHAAYLKAKDELHPTHQRLRNQGF